jgi:hypothetical protein
MLIGYPAKAQNIMPWSMLLLPDDTTGTGNDVNIKKLEATLCRSARCDVYRGFSTSAVCVEFLEQYFDTVGQIPSCIPRYTDIEQGNDAPTNELWCYVNWKMDQLDCDQYFDPATDKYKIIDESDGTTRYEVCLMNKEAMKDVCASMQHIRCWASCRTELYRPCYQEYDLTHDQTVLDECLAKIQPKLEKCEKKEDRMLDKNCQSYLYPAQ